MCAVEWDNGSFPHTKLILNSYQTQPKRITKVNKSKAITLLGAPKKELPVSPQTPEEILVAMKAVSQNYYREAIATNCHTFIEFTGLINEYIKICEENLKLGIDFTKTSVHNPGKPKLEIQPHQLDYINEKLRCIFPKLALVKAEAELVEREERHETMDDYVGEDIMDRYIDPENFNNIEPSEYF